MTTLNSNDEQTTDSSAAVAVAPQVDLCRVDIAKYALTLHLEAFNHRYELFVKAAALYLAVVGAVVGYIT